MPEGYAIIVQTQCFYFREISLKCNCTRNRHAYKRIVSYAALWRH